MRRHPTTTRRAAITVLLAATMLAACGSDTTESQPTDPVATELATTTVAPTTTTPTTTAPPTTEVPVTEVPATDAPTTDAPTTTAEPVPSEQLVLWPPPGVVLDTPEAAATDFVSTFFGYEPTLGEFQQGDANSGEIIVLAGEVEPLVDRAVLFVRQVGAGGGWFVIGAASEGVQLSTPSTGDTVPPGALTVEGVGRGFESTINVVAYRRDAEATELDQAIGAGGALGTLEPFDVTLDLSAASPGDTVILLARGDTGLSDDTGEFTAIGLIVG